MSKKRTRSQRSFYVRLMRPVFQTAILAINASTEQQAASIALRRASGIDEKDWIGRFDRRFYAYDVQTLVGDGLGVESVEKRDLGPSSEFQYLLLKANLYYGEGQLLVQPWLRRQGNLMISDLSHDWLHDISVVYEDGVAAYHKYLREMAGRRSVVDHKGNVIPFRPRSSEDEGET